MSKSSQLVVALTPLLISLVSSAGCAIEVCSQEKLVAPPVSKTGKVIALAGIIVLLVFFCPSADLDSTGLPG